MPTPAEIKLYLESFELEPIPTPAKTIRALATQDLGAAYLSEHPPVPMGYTPAWALMKLDRLRPWIKRLSREEIPKLDKGLNRELACFFAGERGLFGRGDLLPSVQWQDSLLASIIAACPQDASDLCVYISLSALMRLGQGELDPALKGQDLYLSKIASYIFKNTPVTKVVSRSYLFEQGRAPVFVGHPGSWDADAEAIAVVSSNALSFALEESVTPWCYYDPTKSCIALKVRPPSLYIKVRRGQEGNVVRINLPSCVESATPPKFSLIF